MGTFFARRGYPKRIITTSQRKAKDTSRDMALRTSRRETSGRSDRLRLVVTYHPKNQEVKIILIKNFKILTDDPSAKHIFNDIPMCIYRRDSNLRDMLVHSSFSSRPEHEQASAGTFPCCRSRCRTCTFTGKTDIIPSTGGGIRLKDRFDCTAASVIYVIACHRCHAMYIGETCRRLSDRFGEHLHSVEGFSHNTRYQGGGFPVAEHFNLPKNGGINDMRVSVLKQTTVGTQRRQSEERRLIHRLGTLAPCGLNVGMTSNFITLA